jgi:signal transduction histidine kinase
VRLADDLLVLARSDRGALPLRRERLDLRSLLDGIAERFRLPAGSVRVPDGLAVHADGLRLQQALGNLVANALAHGDGGVRLSARREGESVEVHVEDDGPGLPADFVPRAFDRFTRADGARTGGGAGLGLAIVDAIARAHGGRSGVGARASGADVWIALPALIDASSKMPTTHP